MSIARAGQEDYPASRARERRRQRHGAAKGRDGESKGRGGESKQGPPAVPMLDVSGARLRANEMPVWYPRRCGACALDLLPAPGRLLSFSQALPLVLAQRRQEVA